MISPRLLVAASLSLRVSNMFFHAHKCTCDMDEKGLGRDKCSLVSTTPIMSWPSPSSLTCFTSLSLPDFRRKSDCLIQSMLDNSGKSAQYLINIGGKQMVNSGLCKMARVYKIFLLWARDFMFLSYMWTQGAKTWCFCHFIHTSKNG